MRFISFNGEILPADQPILMAANRGYRYGDGLFETMKLLKGRIILGELHFQRLFNGLEILGFKIPKLFTPQKLQEEILRVCQKNNCETAARIRLSVSRGDGGLYDDPGQLQYLIECWPLSSSANTLNENGLIIDVFPDARKSCDKFSSVKSANYLPYVMAAKFVEENKLNEALILNQYERIADATIANVFIIKKDGIITPALSEGCVAGVMRRYLLDKVSSFAFAAADKQDTLLRQSSGGQARYKVKEGVLQIHDLEEADEIFMTNATYGIRWVKSFRNKTYGNQQTQIIFNEFIKTIFS
jgi:branched-chain amino acid aminotransferase